VCCRLKPARESISQPTQDSAYAASWANFSSALRAGLVVSRRLSVVRDRRSFDSGGQKRAAFAQDDSGVGVMV
jgi:hypothetical protein